MGSMEVTEDPEITRVLAGQAHDDRSTIIAQRDDSQPAGAAIGARLENHYPVIEVRGGRGVTGMGVVYIVDDGGKMYAVKTFQRRFARELAFIERFVREARTWMLIGFHPNIVHAYRVEIIDALPYLFIEYVPGDTLGRHSLAEYLRQGPLTLRQTMDFALQFCEGMAHAVRAVPGLVHRDIKPDNVLVRPDGQIKISDFGLVRARGDDDTALAALARSAMEAKGGDHLTEIGSVFGTPAYMAPEQFRGAQHAGEAADIYAFGCILYEMLAGRAPFRAEDTPTLDRLSAFRRLHLEQQPRPVFDFRVDCPPALAEITMRCLEKAPGERWISFDALRLALQDLYPEVCGEAPPPMPCTDAMPEQVAAQMRSMTLLDGYAQAIRLNRLRERHEESPYAFHLALASYFHCHGDDAEEQRQLERAIESRVQELGSEAVRRLADLNVKHGRPAEALALVEPFAAQGPVSAEQVLEPRVQALIAAGRMDEARALVDALGRTRRGHWLRIALAKSLRDAEQLRDAGQGLLSLVMEELLGSVDLCGEMGEPGFAYGTDPAVLKSVLNEIAPNTDTAGLEAEAVFWPNIGGMPDFSGPMAWLSEACGALGACSVLDDAERDMFANAAEALNWPRRMREHLEREEYWFWLQQALPADERFHGRE